MVQCEAGLSLVRKREAWNIVLKEKAAAVSVMHPIPVQETPPCAHINRYKAALVFRAPPVCVCVLSAHPDMTLRKKEMGSGSDWKKPFGLCQSLPCAPGNSIILKGSGQASKGKSAGSVIQKALHKLNETQPFLDLRDHIVFLSNLQLDYLFEMVSNMPVPRLGAK